MRSPFVGAVIGGAIVALLVAVWYFGVYDTPTARCSRGDLGACLALGLREVQQAPNSSPTAPSAPGSAATCSPGYAQGCGPWSTLTPGECAYGVDYNDYGDGHPGYGTLVESEVDPRSGACSALGTFLTAHTSAAWEFVTRSDVWLDGSSIACQGRADDLTGGTTLYVVYDIYATGGPGIDACHALGLSG